jgi:hypothetical protein
MRNGKAKKLLTGVIPARFVMLARKSRTFLRRKKYFWDLKRLKPFRVSSIHYNANMLVVQKPAYVSVSRICVLSFLKYHPNSKVTIRVDRETIDFAERTYAKEIKTQQVILVDVSSNLTSWQAKKIDLICSMSGEFNFYMDADLRWNGPLELHENMTFFVREFLIGEHLAYSEAFRSINLNHVNQAVMKNTSFFYWGTQVDLPHLKEKILNVYREVLDALENSTLNTKAQKDLIRLSEQIAISVALNEDETGLVYLKLKDGQMDGSYLESSYYGATGTSF